MSGSGQSAVQSGILTLGATPLGNPHDASDRLKHALERADVIAAEDTRRLRRLANDLEVTPRGRVISLHDSVEGARIDGLLDELRKGHQVLVVSDAGMPAISDPGYRLVRAAIDADIRVTVLPGPSAVLAALVVSGLPVDRFCFEGFLPRRAGERRRRLEVLASDPRTTVFFEAPHRIGESLADLADIFGAERPAALCRELTKTYEEIRRGTLADLAEGAIDVRGEITLVVGGASERQAGEPGDWSAEVAALVAGGTDRREAISLVATEHGVPRRSVYDAVVAAKATGSAGTP